MQVFIWYLLFLLFYALVMLFGWEGGPATCFANGLARAWGPEAARIATGVGLSFVGAFFVHLLIVLQSFVFNVYASFMLMARFKLELDQREAREQGGSDPPAAPTQE